MSRIIRYGWYIFVWIRGYINKKRIMREGNHGIYDERALLSGSHTPAERGLPIDVSRFRDPTVQVSASF